MAQTKAPLVTVVIAIDRQRERGEGALRSVLAQPRIDECEVLLFDFGADRWPPVPSSAHPAVVCLPLRRGWTFGNVRAYAATLARAPIVAFIEEHVRVAEGWLDALLAAFRDGVDGVGGVPYNPNPETAASRLIFLRIYRAFCHGTQVEERTLLPGQNSAYRTATLRRLSPLALETEPSLDAAIVRDGGCLILDPGIRFGHLNETKLRTFASGIYHLGRVLAWVLPIAMRWSRAKRLWRTLRAPASPPLRLAKLLLDPSLSTDDRRLIVRHSLGLLFVEYAQEAGIVLGMVAGPGDAPRRFLDYDLNAPR